MKETGPSDKMKAERKIQMMRLAELRKKNGLTQEQLAEKIGVSRQAVSKWESGLATPELENLRALCAVFQITLDELAGQSQVQPAEQAQPEKEEPDFKKRLGLALCIAGTLCLVLACALALLLPRAVDRLGASSTVTLNGFGLLILLFVLLLAFGAFLLWKKK